MRLPFSTVQNFSPSNPLRHRQHAAQQLQRRVVVQVLLLARGPPHLDAGEQQEGAEHIEHPVELRDQPAAHQDHHGAQHDRTDDAVHQHPLLVGRRHREVGEDHQEDEDVVDRERLLDQVAGEELERAGVRRGGDGGIVMRLQRPPEQGIEGQAEQHPDDGPLDRLGHRDFVGALLAQHHEVDEQCHQHRHDEKRPQPIRRNGIHTARLPLVSTLTIGGMAAAGRGAEESCGGPAGARHRLELRARPTAWRLPTN